MNNAARLKSITAIANTLGDIALQRQNQRHEMLIFKSERDFASNVDLEIESLAREMIEDTFPGEKVVGEENGGDASGSYWIIDPIDGTTNYLREHPYWAVSIAWIEDDVANIGVIAMPGLKETLSGGKHCGVFLNNQLVATEKIIVQPPKLMAIGRNGVWPADNRFTLENNLESDGYMLMTTGCCAVACAFTILGRLDGYHENHISLWDCAAGIAIGEQAQLKIQLQRQQLECTEFSITRS
ncbi:inositol monophosphatase family protein [Vibrio sp. B1Z05]|uniref:inositol monophosphatase family protein n=1 Tax=Vibrio sp. B1Z05 TaxID=2654980 RepID=UPI00128D0E2A|nr:inositol monophosphatase family protein [Vibrio sp. B1Z05]MPW35820.1 hypothetical protein [Vibrio sp. B1Z05]